MSKPRPTPEDVAELAEAVQYMIQIHSASIAPAMRGRLKRAVKPFLPDPEEELIEAMALAYANAADLNLLVGDEITVDRHMNGIRAALAAFRAHKGGTS